MPERTPPKKTQIEGWVFDVQEEAKGVGLWLVDGQGKAQKFFYPFRPYFYIAGNRSRLEAALRILKQWKLPIFLQREEKGEFYSNRTIPCLEAPHLSSAGGEGGVLFEQDHPLPQGLHGFSAGLHEDREGPYRGEGGGL
jgi:hypothetical protein